MASDHPTAPGAGGIDVTGLVVERGGRRVLDGVGFTVPPGSVYALLGGNGAGKSTTLFALLGLLRPTAGRISVAGHDPARDPDRVRAATAYLPENVALYEHLSARENVRYLLDLAGWRPGPAHPSADAAMAAAFDTVRLSADARDRRVGTFSKGMRQKTAIALALLRDAPVLLLDEPTSGLDPGAARDFHDLVAGLRARDVAILMVTHDLLGAVDLADAVGLLDAGRITREWRAAPAGSNGPRFDLADLHAAVSGRAGA